MNQEHESHRPPQQQNVRRWVFWGFLAIAAFFLLSEHRAHALGVLPYALLLACPLMHRLMHRGQGKGHHHD